MIKYSKKAQRAELINWLHYVIDKNKPDLMNGPTDMEIEIPVEIDDQKTWDLIEANIRDRGMRFKVDYIDKTQDNNYYYMYIWEHDDLNSNRKEATTMFKKTLKMNCANGTFNAKTFDHYLRSLVEDCVEYASECGEPVQIIEKRYPGYNWEWASEGTDPTWDKLRKDLQNALYNYIEYMYLAYKDENEEDL